MQRMRSNGVYERKLIELGPKGLARRLMNPFVSGSRTSLDAFDLFKNSYSNAYYRMNRLE
jgi:hypothetical protein